MRFLFVAILNISFLFGSSYELPKYHPLYPTVKRLFRTSAPLQNTQALNKAGFLLISNRARNHMKVVRHPLAKGYVFKFFLASDTLKRPKRQRQNFIVRCKRARIIKGLIEQHKMRYFSVPDKWIYTCPNKQTILVASAMRLRPEQETVQAWKTVVTRELLDELYILIRAVPISQRLDENLPYTKEGTFAFIDTEARLYPLIELGKFFSPEMKAYWEQLVMSH